EQQAAQQGPIAERVPAQQQLVHVALMVIAPRFETRGEVGNRHALDLLAHRPLLDPPIVVDERAQLTRERGTIHGEEASAWRFNAPHGPPPRLGPLGPGPGREPAAFILPAAAGARRRAPRSRARSARSRSAGGS